MQQIDMDIRQKYARIRGKPAIICGNADCLLCIHPDEEWQSADGPAAQIAYLRKGRPVFETVPLTDWCCTLPPVHETCEILISVTANGIRTAAPAPVVCVPCITDHAGIPHHPAPDCFNRLMELLAVQQGKDHFRYGTHLELGFLPHSTLAHYTHGELGKGALS
ncbi:MAG: hypothetical protein IK130_04565 [Oscillospiraceae bacterium]|nr:hypothetical protein [Oscillospiraceae bacterium]